MTATTERKCRCGTVMSLIREACWACDNCDSVQAGQMLNTPRPRVRTVADVRFDMSWLAEMTVQYGPLPPDVSTDDLYMEP